LYDVFCLFLILFGYWYLLFVLHFLCLLVYHKMDSTSFNLAEEFLPKAYVNQARQAASQRTTLINALLSQVEVASVFLIVELK